MADNLIGITESFIGFHGSRVWYCELNWQYPGAAKYADLKHNMLFLPWARGYLGVEKQHFEATFPYVFTPERDALFIYSNPLVQTQVTVFTRKNIAS